MNLVLKHEVRNNVDVLRLQGEVDIYTAPKLKDSLYPLVEQTNSAVTVDVGDVSYMDSTGLGVLIGALKLSEKHGGKIELVNPNSRVDRLLNITGLSDVMQVRQREGI